MKSCFVLWSAGVDSTYLILRLLENGYQVNAGYIDIRNNGKKTHMELAAIEKMTAQILAHFPKFNYQGVVYEARNNCASMPDTRGLRYRQVPYFINAMMAAPATDYRALGYVKGDSAIKNLENIRAVYDAYKLIHYKALPELVFPIRNIDKVQIFQHMIKTYPEIIGNCVWCEHPKGAEFVPCHACTPCKRRERELKELGYHEYY